jgi:cytoskeletal protein CcmA (bactofilin family)
MSHEYLDIKRQNFSYVGHKCTINGDMDVCGETHVIGQVNGNITVKDKSTLTVSPNGIVKGELNGHNIEIYGSFEGILRSSGKVSIYPSAHVKGQLEAISFNILPGAHVEFDAHTLEDKQ